MLLSELEKIDRLLDPWRELERMKRTLSGLAASSGNEFPAVNFWNGADDLTLTAELPGVDPQTVEISVQGKTLTIRGSRKAEELKEGESYHRHERWAGKFTRTIGLPFEIRDSAVKAVYRNGVLAIELPRAEEQSPRKISIESQ